MSWEALGAKGQLVEDEPGLGHISWCRASILAPRRCKGNSSVLPWSRPAPDFSVLLPAPSDYCTLPTPVSAATSTSLPNPVTPFHSPVTSERY